VKAGRRGAAGADYREAVTRSARPSRPHRWFAALVIAVAGLALAGCTQSGSRAHVSGTGAAVAAQPSATATAQPAADGVQQVVIDATDEFHFKPDTVLARPGKLRITLTNPSVFPVDLAIPTLGVHSTTVFAGKSSVIEVTISAAGDYSFVCTFHEHDGMTGTLIVS
jgi:plastocyanin